MPSHTIRIDPSSASTSGRCNSWLRLGIPLPLQPGRSRRIDYEYRRNGACNLFTTIEPLTGWRHIEVTDRRTPLDFAHQMKWVVDERIPVPPSLCRSRQPERARQSVAVRRVRPGRSTAYRQKARVPLHAEARQLAQRGGMRARCRRQPMLGATAGRRPHRPSRDRCLEAPAQY
jgi:hypothetical protein